MSSDEKYKNVMWKHAKTGGLYRIVDFMLREEDLCPLVAYTGYDKFTQVFVREATQFFDGRFRTMIDEPEAEPEGGIICRDAYEAVLAVGDVVIEDEQQAEGPITAYVVTRLLDDNQIGLQGRKGTVQADDFRRVSNSAGLASSGYIIASPLRGSPREFA